MVENKKRKISFFLFLKKILLYRKGVTFGEAFKFPPHLRPFFLRASSTHEKRAPAGRAATTVTCSDTVHAIHYQLINSSSHGRCDTLRVVPSVPPNPLPPRTNSNSTRKTPQKEIRIIFLFPISSEQNTPAFSNTSATHLYRSPPVVQLYARYFPPLRQRKVSASASQVVSLLTATK